METILVPTDFSAAARNALDYAVELSNLFDSRIILVNATPLPMPSYDSTLPIEIMTDLEKSSKEGLENLKKEIQSRSKRKLTVTCYTEMGYAEDVVENAARKNEADLIVLGIIGEAGKLKEHLIGSTAVKVARNINIPTFIIPENIHYQKIKKIAFACDLNKTEETTLLYIVKFFSKLFDAELEVIHIEHPYEEISTEKSRSSSYLERKLEDVKHKTTYITHSEVARGLEDYLRSNPADLLMINPKKHGIFYNLFNESVTKELAFHTNMPILSIH